MSAEEIFAALAAVDVNSFEGHTPGPWKVGTPGPNYCPTVGTRHGLMVAMVAYGADHPTEANARLIAASPQMLPLLREMPKMESRLREQEERIKTLEEQVATLAGDDEPEAICGRIFELQSQLSAAQKLAEEAELERIRQVDGLLALLSAERAARGEGTVLEIFVYDRAAMFVCGAWGHVTSGMIDEIEQDFGEPGSWIDSIPMEAETVRVRVEHVPAQIGDEGRVELPAYYDLTPIDFKLIDAALSSSGAKEQR